MGAVLQTSMENVQMKMYFNGSDINMCVHVHVLLT